MTDPHAIVTPDDSGSDTLARFQYQAHVTFPYCLKLATGDCVTDVYAEHIEDIAVRESDAWRFLQVKSRKPERGQWTIGEVIKSGAIASLWRAYQAAGRSVVATYEICLEGTLRKDDPLKALAEETELPDDTLVRLADECGVAVDEVFDFAGRLRVLELPELASIAAQNLRLMMKTAPDVAAREIEKTYWSAIEVIETAMTADSLAGDWPAALFLTRNERLEARVEKKRITAERARAMLAPILATATSSAATIQDAPFVLPQVDVPTFTGRSAELQHLEAILLRESGIKVSSIAGISGTGGLGKTALACHFAELHRRDFADGVIGLRVDGKEPITVARDFVRSAWVDLDPDDERDAPTLMQEVFRDRRALLIFDNTRDGSIRSLLPGGTRCAVIITTRDRQLPAALGLPDEARLDVSPLSGDDAARLFKMLLPERVAAQPDAAARICTLVGNLPLAIQIAGATLRMQSWLTLTEFEADLREEKERLTLLTVEGDSTLDLRASFSLSLDQLDTAHAEFFACLGVCAPDGFSIVSAAAASGCPDRAARDRLTKLFRLSLVNRKSNRFVMHPLLRLFAREHAAQLGVLHTAESRHRDFFCALVMRQDPADPAAAALLAADIEDILTAAESLERAGKLDTEFLLRVEPLFRKQGYWIDKFGGLLLRPDEPEEVARPLATIEPVAHEPAYDSAALLTQADLLQQAGNLAGAAELLQQAIMSADDDARPRAMALHSLGGVLQRQGKFEEAVDAYQLSHELSRELGDHRAEAMTLISIGGVLQRQGQFDRAANVFRSASALAETLAERGLAAMALSDLGGVLQRMGSFEEAVVAFRQSYEILVERGDSRGQAMALSNLGGVFQRQGDFDRAAGALRESYAVFEQLGDTRGMGMSLNSLGGVLQRQGKFDEAAHVFRATFAILEQLGDRRGLAMALNNLGGVLQRQGRYDEAVETLQRSHVIAAELADVRGQATVLYSMGGVLQRQGKLDQAIDAFRRSYEISVRLNDARSQAMVLYSLGGVLQRQGKLDQAIDAFRRSYEISARLNDARSQAMVLVSLGSVLRRQGRLAEAFDVFRRSIAIGKNLGDQRHLAIAHMQFGLALLRTDRNTAAEEFREAFELEAALHDRKGIEKVARILVETLIKLGRVDEALELCERALAIIPRDQRLLALKGDLTSRNGRGAV